MDDFDDVTFEDLFWLADEDEDMDTTQEIWSAWEWDDMLRDS